MVKQSKNVESTWYFFVKSIKDEKIRKKLIAPVGLTLLLAGLMLLLPLFRAIAALDVNLVVDEITIRWWVILMFLAGMVLIQNAFRVRESLRSGVKRARRSIYQGDVTIPVFLFAAVVFVLGIAKGLQASGAELDPQFEGNYVRSLLFLDGSFYWFMASSLIFESRRMANALIQREIIPKGFWLISMFMVAVTFLVLGAVHYLMLSMDLPLYAGDQVTMGVEVVVGLAIFTAGALIQRRMKSEVWVSKEGWRR
jgi:putative membrane protein